MHPHEHVGLAGDVALDQGDVLRAVDQRLVADRPELAEARGHLHDGHPAHELLGAPPVADEVGHGDHLDAVPPAVADQVGHSRHGAVVVHDLADHGRRLQAGEAREVDAGLGLAGALEHAARRRDEREDVAGLHDVVGPALGVDGHLDGARAIGRRDAGGHPVARLDRLREGGLEARRVLGHHGPQVELFAALRGEREADQAAAVGRHEVDRLGRDELGRHGEVAFVLAALVVADHDHAAGADVGQGFVDRGEVGRVAPLVGRRARARGREGRVVAVGRGRVGAAHRYPASDSFSKVRPWVDPDRER